MTLILTCLIIGLTILNAIQFRIKKQRDAQLAFLSKKLHQIREESSFEQLLLATDDQYLRALLVEINQLMDNNQRIEAQFTRTERSIKKMLSNISHDLKTPLTVVLGYIETIQHDPGIVQKEKEKILLNIHEKTSEIIKLMNSFDEPINGLDPVGVKEIRDVFHTLNKEYGTTLLISSHILAEIEQLADVIGVIRDGRLISEIPMDSIRRQTTQYIEITTTNQRKAYFVIVDKLHISNFKVIDEKTIRIYESKISQEVISKTLVLHDVGIESMNRKAMSLEEYFLGLIHDDKIHS